MTQPTQPSALKIVACTSPHSDPWAGGSSRSLTTTTRGAGIVRTYAYSSLLPAPAQSGAGAPRATIVAVAAYPTIRPSSGNMHLMRLSAKPMSRDCMSNVSIALASVGES